MNVQRRRLQQPVRLARQLVAFRLFLADRQQPDARRLDAERHARVDAAHDRELQQMLRPALDAGADVEQHRRRRCASESSAASAGRSTPGSMPNAPCAAITVAPVCPALKSAAASPRATSSAATLIDARGLRRSAAAGDSSIVDHVGRRRRCGRVDDRRRDAARARRRIASARPTRSTPRSKWRAAARAPSTTCRGRMIAAHRVNGDPDHRGAACQVTYSSSTARAWRPR